MAFSFQGLCSLGVNVGNYKMYWVSGIIDLQKFMHMFKVTAWP